jgi:alpha-tubulin suppressor-like RCC1 family protein
VIDLGGATVRQVARGASHTCVLEDSGRVRCWGARDHGHLGDGIDNTSATSAPGASAVTGLDVGSGVTQIEARGGHTCVVRNGSEIRCWGLNDMGQLGDGTTTDRAVPTVVRW